MKRAMLYTGAVLVVLVALVAGLREVARSRSYQLMGRLVARVDTPERRVALTFDDGPTRKLADSLVRLLAAHGAKATFFVIGSDLAKAPEAGRVLAAGGHELGNHSYTHQHMVLHSLGFVRSELERTDSLIREAGYRGPIFFRPPYGYKLVVLPRYLSRTNRTTIMWDINPDSYVNDRAAIVRHALDRVRPGSIILLHVWYPSRAASLDAVGPLIDSLRAHRYEVGSVGELLASEVRSSRP